MRVRDKGDLEMKLVGGLWPSGFSGVSCLGEANFPLTGWEGAACNAPHLWAG